MFLFLMSMVASAAAPLTCGTPEILHDLVGKPPPVTAAPFTDLIDQESHGEIANVQYSERFALKWGPDFDLGDEAASRLLDDFEYSHSMEVLEWSMSDPTGVGGTYFNVYIGDTGGDVPSVFGNAGYYTLDASGFPMIVLSRDLIGDVGYVRSVIAHEFFHAVQHAEDAFYYEDTGRWYWEATACWASGQIVPESNSFFGFLPWYALQPAAGMYHFTYEEFGGAPPDLHQYGAVIFPWYISEVLHVSEAILASWRIGDPGGDPMEALETILSEEVVARAVADHGARNLSWDYALGPQFSDHVEGWAGHFSAQDRRHASLIDHPTEGFYSVDPEYYPRAMGYTLVQLPDSAVTPAGRLTVLLADDPEATADPPPDHPNLRATLIEFTSSGPEYREVRADIPHTNFWVEEGAELWLSIANTGLLSEAFYPTPFKLSFVPLPDAPEPESEDTGVPEDTGPHTSPGDTGDTGSNSDTGTPEDPPIEYEVPGAVNKETPAGGCSCASTQPPSWPALLALIPLLVRRRSGNHSG